MKAVKDAASLVVVDFSAEWCGPCKYLGAHLPEIADKHPSVKFLKVDIDESRELARDFDIRVVPQVKFFKKGNEDLIPDATVIGADINAVCATINNLS